MRLFNLMIDDDLDRDLKAESKRTGAPMAEIIRRATRRHLDIQRGNNNGQGNRRPRKPRKADQCEA